MVDNALRILDIAELERNINAKQKKIILNIKGEKTSHSSNKQWIATGMASTVFQSSFHLGNVSHKVIIK